MIIIESSFVLVFDSAGGRSCSFGLYYKKFGASSFSIKKRTAGEKN